MPQIFFRKNILKRFLSKKEIDSLEEEYRGALLHGSRKRRTKWDKESGRKHPWLNKRSENTKEQLKQTEDTMKLKFIFKGGDVLEITDTKDLVISGEPEKVLVQKKRKATRKYRIKGRKNGKTCVICGNSLARNQTKYCSGGCRREAMAKWARERYRTKKARKAMTGMPPAPVVPGITL